MCLKMFKKLIYGFEITVQKADFYFLESQRKTLFLQLFCPILTGDFSKCFPISVCSLQQVFNPLQVKYVCIWRFYKSTFQQRST